MLNCGNDDLGLHYHSFDVQEQKFKIEWVGSKNRIRRQKIDVLFSGSKRFAFDAIGRQRSVLLRVPQREWTRPVEDMVQDYEVNNADKAHFSRLLKMLTTQTVFCAKPFVCDAMVWQHGTVASHHRHGKTSSIRKMRTHSDNTPPVHLNLPICFATALQRTMTTSSQKHAHAVRKGCVFLRSSSRYHRNSLLVTALNVALRLQCSFMLMT